VLVCQSFEMLVTPGDNVLVESPTYAGALASVCVILLLTCLVIYNYTSNFCALWLTDNCGLWNCPHCS